MFFDTQSISVSLNTATDQVTAVIDLDFDNGNANTNGGQNLEPFSYAGFTLGTGDLFFYDPSATTTQSCANTSPASQCVTVPTNSSLAYAVVLDGGSGLTTGGLYAIDSGSTDTSIELASTALGSPGPGVTYRPGQAVLVTANSGSTSSVGGSQSESVCKVGTAGCVATANGAQYQITLNFIAPTAFLSLLMNGQIGVEFAAADCGNAVTAGNVWVTTTPEPGTLGMIGAGIGLLGLGLVRRRRKS
ncbi:MAG: PEP-CTERM sorting domain-containing protein [Bryobacteraceae bacterium]